MNPAKTAESIEMPFGMWARVGPHNHGLDGIRIPLPQGKEQFWGWEYNGMPMVGIFNKTMRLLRNYIDLLLLTDSLLSFQLIHTVDAACCLSQDISSTPSQQHCCSSELLTSYYILQSRK